MAKKKTAQSFINGLSGKKTGFLKALAGNPLMKESIRKEARKILKKRKK